MEFLSEKLSRARVAKPLHVRLGAEILGNLFRKGATCIFFSDLVADQGWFSIVFSDRVPQFLGYLFGRF